MGTKGAYQEKGGADMNEPEVSWKRKKFSIELAPPDHPVYTRGYMVGFRRARKPADPKKEQEPEKP